ncbi:MAG TPA: Rieske 2Fe-2S domain-containing protein [Acidimicrobiia bacterium]
MSDRGPNRPLEDTPAREAEEQRATRRIAAVFAVSAVAALGLAITYIAGGQPQVEGALLAVALGGIGAGLVMWAAHLLPNEPVIGEREPMESDEREREAFVHEFSGGEQQLVRRRFLTRMLAVAGGALGVAALFPIRSLGPSPGHSLTRTKWRRGSRVVDETGRAVRMGDVRLNGIVTVFPEGHVDDATSQTVLIHVPPDELRLSAQRESWAPNGYVAYSKICTHAGCPVGLYRTSDHQLLCPCHQSTFDVLEGARPVFGPAARPLPQLPMEVDDQGYLVARSDYTEPVGPSFWNRK